MKNRTIKSLLFGSVLALGAMVSCEKNNGPDDGSDSGASGPDNQPRQFITLTAAIPGSNGRAGDGGTSAYALTLEEATDATKELDIYTNGYGLRSQRTARVQGSINGNFLYNIQYTGTNGGVFNKYRVTGGADFEDTNEELNVASMLSTSPRWVKAAEGIGVGVKIEGAEAPIDPAKAEVGEQTYEYVRGSVDIAIIDLDDPRVPNSTEFDFPFTDEEKEAGYAVGRIDVPVINGNKIYIGCALSKVDPTKEPVSSTDDNTGEVSWSWQDDSENIRGTVTLVVDYPSLANPKVIWSTQSKASNNSYRTMTQYVGTDGHVYQATATSGSQILRINRNTADYDNSYNFDLKTALGTQNDVQIKAWRYIADGIGLVLYTESNVDGGYLALIDLNAVTARKLSTDNESDTNFSTTFGQYQNIGVAGNYAYVPLTASGKDGHLYIVNWRTGDVTKGIKLKGEVGSHFIGAY
ncbi:hypothetical protein [Sphingobacterium gobiense]|uniref:DUF4374 domain-containing protein n=1 Tax=Sphingobacterium gobiense TaxID=1382456 RepID=A0A2S9JLD9_9SPHI|nr:hypothetical protein [Sphingobacterium gobiense]PRD53970.1 hypothetical protein C5749_10700 [Sphingobacterium gobiense]